MPSSASSGSTSAPAIAAVDAAFAAVTRYDSGTARGVLMALDEATQAALDDDAARGALERRLVVVLQGDLSRAAREYVCAKLGLIGSAQCVPAVAALLDDPWADTAARSVLEVIPGDAATRALLDHLPKCAGSRRIGVINSLGQRRDERGVRALAGLLGEQDDAVVRAAAAALGEIGSPNAGRTLLAFLPKAPATVRREVAEACRVCAARLDPGGHDALARSLMSALAAQ